jgi:Transketolase
MTNNSKLEKLSDLLRRDVIEMTTEAGSGHPTSCMSCAEVFSVLFFDEMNYDPEDASNPGNDEFVLSKGHSAPIWYASLDRAGAIDENLDSLRKLDSHLQGHPMPISLEWVEEATGSLGQGLSIATGKALAAKKQDRSYHTYTVLGDSEVSEGQIYEALELASYYDLDNLTAVVDVNRLGQRGETIVGHHMNWYKDRFSSFGWNVEVIDGHSVQEIKNAFESSHASDRPTVVLAETVKGKGVSLTEGEEGWHGVPLTEEEMQDAFEELPSPEMPEFRISKPEKQEKPSFQEKEVDMKTYEQGEVLATRDAYGNALADLAEARSEVLAVDGEVSNSTRSEYIKEDNPDQFVESFIAEQNMISMAQGLSIKGYEVFTSTFSAFISRAHDQIRMAALSEAEITVVGSHAGVSIGQDGASQMGLSDIALFRALRESRVMYPCDGNSARKMVENAHRSGNLDYIRTTRPETEVIYSPEEEFPVGEFKKVEEPEDPDVVLAGAGITVHEALEAKKMLEQEGVQAAVVDIYCVKPFNSYNFRRFVESNSEKLVVSEDHYPEGGIGEMLGKELEESDIEMRTLAVDKIPHSGGKQELLENCGIDRKAIKKQALNLVEQH